MEKNQKWIKMILERFGGKTKSSLVGFDWFAT